jgi:hypothetical protein
MVICGILWRIGGMEGGFKPARWLGVPAVICIVSALTLHSWILMLAIPFMVKIAPAYGENSWLKKVTNSDILTRLVCFAWYWAAFSIPFLILTIQTL